MTEGCVDETDGTTTFSVCNQDFAGNPNGIRLVQHGDSGGPVLAHDGGFVTAAIGVISGGNVGSDSNPGPGTDVNFTDGGDVCAISGWC
jgi:hypothetical protein